MQRLNNHSLKLSAATMLALLLGAYLVSSQAWAANDTRDISRTNGRVEVAAAEQVGNVSSVNGSIFLGSGAVAGRVRTVNGSIRLDHESAVENAQTVNGGIEAANLSRVAGTLSTVNGGIALREEVSVDGSVSAVNGHISMERGTRVNGEVRNVNGPIRLLQAEIGENLTSSNGDIELTEGTVVYGDLVYRSNRNWFSRFFSFRDDPELYIDATSSVRGDIHLHREVQLHISPDADVGEIIRHF